MKKLVAILAIVLFAGSTAFATVNVHASLDKKEGTGTFICNVIAPLTITGPSEDINLGEFVVDATNPYTISDVTMTFNIGGQASHSFYYNITESKSNDNASIVIAWKANGTATTAGTTNTATLTSAGTATITGTVSQLTAKSASNDNVEFEQKVTVSYNTF